MGSINTLILLVAIDFRCIFCDF